jgi:hypothetical protein
LSYKVLSFGDLRALQISISFKAGARAMGAVLASLVLFPEHVFAHGFAGARFFPATLTTDDPFVADELSLPTFQEFRQPGSPPVKTFDFSWDISKEIFTNLGISLGNGYEIEKPRSMKSSSGFTNLDFSILYQLPKNPEHEFVGSLGLTGELGGTGQKPADSFTTMVPTLYFGKGFGDLPECISLLRPLAITGTFGVAFPTSSATRSESGVDRHPNTINLGIALEYSLIYLQSQVKNVGLRFPFDGLIPLVEFAIQSPLNRGGTGPATGTVNPGVIWSGRYFQIGVEALIPVNEHTGRNIGVIAQLHFYLDDLLPGLFGKPLVGN